MRKRKGKKHTRRNDRFGSNDPTFRSRESGRKPAQTGDTARTLYHGWKQITRSLLARKMSRMYMVVGQTGAIRWILCARSTKCCYIPANSPPNPPGSPFFHPFFPRFIRDKFDRMHPAPTTASSCQSFDFPRCLFENKPLSPLSLSLSLYHPTNGVGSFKRDRIEYYYIRILRKIAGKPEFVS